MRTVALDPWCRPTLPVFCGKSPVFNEMAAWFSRNSMVLCDLKLKMLLTKNLRAGLASRSGSGMVLEVILEPLCSKGSYLSAIPAKIFGGVHARKRPELEDAGAQFPRSLRESAALWQRVDRIAAVSGDVRAFSGSDFERGIFFDPRSPNARDRSHAPRGNGR